MGAPGKVVRAADGDALARASADDFVALATAAVAARGVFHVALSGGSTPKKTFDILAKRSASQALPWDRIVLWWGDERTVPPDHPDSNYGMAKAHLIDPLGLDGSRVHRMVGEGADFAAHQASAASYEQLITTALGTPPVFDLIMLGMGPDGHCASLFPHTPGLDAPGFVVANQLAETNLPGKTVRITLTPRAINAGRHVRFAIGGADKATSLAAVLEGPRDPHTFPSQLIAAASGDLVWMIEDAAAAKLRGGAS
jgi:6-phosphogluconolactonase|nr:6-phosphogluconolactonase [Kofleriaceae bacterium]